MKYSRLTKEQFEIFHEKFAKFLATQQIDKDEWKKIVETKKELSVELLDLFSDIIWEDGLANAQYLEHYSEKDFKAFKFGEDHVDMVAVKIKGDLDINFTEENAFKKLFEKIMDPNVELFNGKKKIEGERNVEMFELIKEGCIISSPQLFEALSEAIKS